MGYFSPTQMGGAVEGPASSDYGAGLYDFGYAATSQPPSQVATSASQLESGGSGFDWGQMLGTVADVTKAYMQIEAVKSGAPMGPVQYRTNGNGQVYATDPTYQQQGGVNTLGGVGSALGGIPTAWLMIGGIVALAIFLGKD